VKKAMPALLWSASLRLALWIVAVAATQLRSCVLSAPQGYKRTFIKTLCSGSATMVKRNQIGA
jgi:hypothetical protein